MARFGVDYVGGPPGAAALKAAGVTFVCRYVSTPGNPKNMSRAEVEQLSAAGIDIVTNYESTAGAMKGGSSAGVAAAKSALAQAKACGMPDGRPIYFSADLEEFNKPDVYRHAADFCRGAASVLGIENVGVYGSFWVCKRALDDGVAKWAWQTTAWSSDKHHHTMWEPRAQIRQNWDGAHVVGQRNINKVTCDVDTALTTDFGQWRIGMGGDWFDMATLDDLKRAVRDVLNEGTGAGQNTWAGTNKALLHTAQDAVNEIRRHGGGSPLDPAALAQHLSDLLGPVLSAKVADAIHHRLSQPANSGSSRTERGAEPQHD